MATDAQDAAERALRSRRASCKTVGVAAFGAAAMTSHASLHANTAAAGMAGSLFVATAAITAYSELSQAPADVVWIWASVAGTMAGAFAAVMASMILQPRATKRRHLAYLLLAFVFGMIGAPMVGLAWSPEPPKHIPMAFIWFSMSGFGGFLAPALAIALSKRSDDVANDMIDKFTTPREAREQAKRRRNKDSNNDDDEGRNDT